MKHGMTKIPLFPTYFYKFSSSSILTERIIDKIKSLKFTHNSSNMVSHNFFDNELFDWFDSCLKEVKNDFEFNNDINLSITECWVNKTSKLTAHHPHFHPNSIVSGIYYLTTCKKGGDTIFFNENNWIKERYPQLRIENKDQKSNENNFSLSSEKGNLIIFPSHIWHKVSTLLIGEDRYTISFNTFFDGIICKSSSTSLTIRLETVRLKQD